MNIRLKYILIVYCSLLLCCVTALMLTIPTQTKAAPKGGTLGNNKDYTVTLYAAPKATTKTQETLKQKKKEITKKSTPQDVIPIKNSQQTKLEKIVTPKEDITLKKQHSTQKHVAKTPIIKTSKANSSALHKVQSQEIKKDIKLVKGGSKQGLNGDLNAPISYQQEVLMYLQNYRYYPPLALRRHISGVAEVKFLVKCNGELESYKMIKSTGNNLLDDAVVKMINDAGSFPKMKDCKQSIAMTLPIEFKVV